MIHTTIVQIGEENQHFDNQLVEQALGLLFDGLVTRPGGFTQCFGRHEGSQLVYTQTDEGYMLTIGTDESPALDLFSRLHQLYDATDAFQRDASQAPAFLVHQLCVDYHVADYSHEDRRIFATELTPQQLARLLDRIVTRGHTFQEAFQEVRDL